MSRYSASRISDRADRDSPVIRESCDRPEHYMKGCTTVGTK